MLPTTSSVRITSLLFWVLVLPACTGGTSDRTVPTAYEAQISHRSSASSLNVPHYTVTDLGTFGGGYSSGDALNNRGSVTGISRTGNDFTCCSIFLWQKGVLQNLGKNGDVGTLENEDHAINDREQIVGWLEPRVPDPEQEHFCSQFENNVCLPFVWRSGTFTVLPTLGGHNANAMAINASGAAAGAGEKTRDASCPPPIAYHIAAVLWSSRGAITELPPARGDSDAVAAAINDGGDAAGTSGTCVAGPIRAVIWKNRTAIVLPSLGGGTFNIAFAINNKGDAAGQSDLPGDTTHHAALWHNNGVTDLGTLYGLPVSLANAMNDSDQVVGFSQNLDNSNTVAELWQNAKTWDLNSLIPANTGLFLIEALDINNAGQITGFALDVKTQETHGFLLTPSERNTTPQSSPVNGMTNVVLPRYVQAMVRKLEQKRFWHRPTQRTQM